MRVEVAGDDRRSDFERDGMTGEVVDPIDLGLEITEGVGV